MKLISYQLVFGRFTDFSRKRGESLQKTRKKTLTNVMKRISLFLFKWYIKGELKITWHKNYKTYLVPISFWQIFWLQSEKRWKFTKKQKKSWQMWWKEFHFFYLNGIKRGLKITWHKNYKTYLVPISFWQIYRLLSEKRWKQKKTRQMRWKNFTFFI